MMKNYRSVACMFLALFYLIVGSCKMSSNENQNDNKNMIMSEAVNILDSLIIENLELVKSSDVNSRQIGIENLKKLIIENNDIIKIISGVGVQIYSEAHSPIVNQKLIKELLWVSNSENVVEGSETATIHKINQKKAIQILRILLEHDSEFTNSNDKEFHELVSKKFK